MFWGRQPKVWILDHILPLICVPGTRPQTRQSTPHTEAAKSFLLFFHVVDIVWTMIAKSSWSTKATSTLHFGQPNGRVECFSGIHINNRIPHSRPPTPSKLISGKSVLQTHKIFKNVSFVWVRGKKYGHFSHFFYILMNFSTVSCRKAYAYYGLLHFFLFSFFQKTYTDT